jgi:hypothetical protein
VGKIESIIPAALTQAPIRKILRDTAGLCGNGSDTQ